MPDDGLLYSLSFDCPFAWPANPNYITAATATSSKLPSSAMTDATASSSMLKNDGEVSLNGTGHANEMAEMSVADDLMNQDEEQKEELWPKSLRELYLECLYSCHSTAACTRLLRAFQLSIYTPGTSVDDQHAATAEKLIQPLRALLISLNRIDERWHTEIPALVNAWEKVGIDAAQAQEENPGEERMEGVETQGLADYTSKYDELELGSLKKAYETWQTTQHGKKMDVKGKGRASPTARPEEGVRTQPVEQPATGLREWLTNLEVLEVQLQTTLALQILSILPVPPRHSKLTHPSSSWLSSIRGGQTPRKRKLAHPTTPLHNGNGIVEERRTTDKIYKTTAVRLDELTDSLAIHQAVGSIGLSLADLMGEDPSDNKKKGGIEELDKYQTFWLDVVEQNYAELLPPDMLSGCHSKFFNSNSLDVSLNPASQRLPQHVGHANSPFHHPTPNLQQLARSVQLAQEQAKKDRIPASPTLAKLLAADREREERNRRNALMLENIMESIEGEDDGLVGDNSMDRDETSWLMPPAVPASMRAPSVSSSNGNRPPTIRSTVGMAKSKSSKNLFQARQVEFGRSKSKSSLDGDAVTRKKKAGFSSMALTATSKVGAGEAKHKVEERINKRKLASPKRKAAASGSKTLVQGTPAKVKPKALNGIANGKPGNPFSRSKSMPDFTSSWNAGLARKPGRIAIVQEEDEEEAGHSAWQGGQGSDTDQDEDQWEDMKSSLHQNGENMLLVGETPQKGGA